jgi:hypothetical protein
MSRYRHAGAKGDISIAPHSWSTRWGWVVSVTLRPRFTPWERTHSTHWIGGWVVLRVGLDTEARGKSFASATDRTPVVHSVVRHYTDWYTPVPQSVEETSKNALTVNYCEASIGNVWRCEGKSNILNQVPRLLSFTVLFSLLIDSRTAEL